ncbi:hypothetical protein NRA31_10160 [Acinetobacter baumannii]|nr:hypothetical protein [Acinetobacter baumannii]
MSDKNFVFPSGLTSQRARALAKEAKKLNGTQLSCELDLISKKECQLPWHKAVAKFTNEDISILHLKGLCCINIQKLSSPQSIQI